VSTSPRAILDHRTDSHIAGRRCRRDEDRMCTVIPTTFVFSGGNAPQAQRVALAGAFNGLNAILAPAHEDVRGRLGHHRLLACGADRVRL